MAGLSEIVAVRRRLHRHPEMGLQLPATQAVVAEELGGSGSSPSSAVGLLGHRADRGCTPGPTVLLRADMEPCRSRRTRDSSSPRRSRASCTPAGMTRTSRCCSAPRGCSSSGATAGRQRPAHVPARRGGLPRGPLHARGGPARTAPSELVGRRAAHRDALRDGHDRPPPGALLAAGDTIRITVRGRGGHASTPHLAADPITVAAEIVIAIQVAVTREIHAFDPVVITIANVVAGTTTNVIPETAYIAGTKPTSGRGAGGGTGARPAGGPGDRRGPRPERRRRVDPVTP